MKMTRLAVGALMVSNATRAPMTASEECYVSLGDSTETTLSDAIMQELAAHQFDSVFDGRQKYPHGPSRHHRKGKVKRW